MRLLFTAFLMLSACPGAADEANTLYESLDNVRLGRLFMTPGERDRLESRRGVTVDESGFLSARDDGSDSQTTAPPRRPAAGYIASSNGKPLVWINGEFRRVETATMERVRFPGTIRIQTGTPIEADPEPAERDDNVATPSSRSDRKSDAATATPRKP